MKGTKLGAKEPWLAANLSLLAPGVGQFYGRRHLLGILIAVFEGFFFGLGVWQFLHPTGNTLAGEVLLVVFALGYVGNVVHAQHVTARSNGRDFEALRKSTKDPWLAVFMGRVLPGLGHFYLRQWTFGAVFLAVTAAGALLLKDNGTGGVLFNIVLYSAVSYHGYLLAPVHRETNKRAIWIFILGLGFVEMLVHVPASVVRDSKIDQGRVKGRSMMPLLREGDRVLVARVAPKAIKRGDVVVFSLPGKPDEQWAKRVLAVGGENIEIRETQLYVSGRLLEGPYFRNIQSLDETDPSGRGKVMHVPEGFVFVVGDDPARSVDSRQFGPIPMGNVIGVPYKVFWPINRIRIIQPMAEQVANTAGQKGT